MQHFNIGKKTEINPFENVKYVTMSSNFANGAAKLEEFLNKKAVEVVTKKINNRFVICFDIELLDFVTLLSWYAPYEGKFYFKSSSVHFSIEDDLMKCW